MPLRPELQLWLQLTLTFRASAARFKYLFQQLGSLDRLPGMSAAWLIELGWSAEQSAQWQSCLAGRLTPVVSKVLQQVNAWAAQPQHHLVAYGDGHYPALLYACADPPPLLYVWGDPALLSLPQLAIVGSRHPSADGRKLARRFAKEVAQCGFRITSGLALGIDVESHLATLEAGVETIAVLGSGIDEVTPHSHRQIAERIALAGAVVSEFPPGVTAEPRYFPERNRIISGLAHGVLVVEAAAKSGSLITARLAAEQGREVFAIPGSINNPLTRGCHQLIRQGAKLVETVDDIMEELAPLVGWQRQQQLFAETAKSAPVAAAALPAQAELILSQLAYDPLSLDALVLATALPVEQLVPELLQLELCGLVVTHNGGYVRSAS